MTQTSTAPAIKAAIIAALQEAPGLAGVDIGYQWDRNMGRECIHGGAISVHQEISGGRDDEGNATRNEVATILIHVRVDARGESVQTAEVRAVEIGGVLEAYLAVHKPDVPGLLAMDIGGYDLTPPSADDDGAFTVATYPVRAESYLS